MKKLQNLIIFAVITVTGAILPVTTASALNETTYFVPIEPCRLLNTRAWGKTQDDPGTAEPFVADKVRSGSTRFDTKHFYVNGGDILIGGQGGSIDDADQCNIPDEAVAIAINLTVNLPEGGVSWLRLWGYDGTLPGEEDGAIATVMSWDGTVLSNAMSVSVTRPEFGFNFTLRVFFDTIDHPLPADNSAHIVGDALGYYVPFNPGGPGLLRNQ